jgi:hypothetical protein
MFLKDDEYRAHSELLGFLSTNPSPEACLKFQRERLRKAGAGLPYQTENFLKSLRLHFEKSVPATEFELIVDGARRDELDRFWVGEVGANSWAELCAKICKMHSACLKCTPSPDQIEKSVKIKIAGHFKTDKTPESTKRFSCALERAPGKRK